MRTQREARGAGAQSGHHVERQQGVAVAKERGPEEANPADTFILDVQPPELWICVSFRYENESHQHGSQSTEFPGQTGEQEPSRRVSRSSFSSNPGGKVQDSSDRSKLTEENVSGKPLVHEENTVAAGTVSDGCEEGVARETPDAVHPSGLPRDNCRNATDSTAGAFQEDSSVTSGSCNGGGKAFPTIQGLKNSDKNESPFRRLYESMKLELDVKSEKVNILQNRRKSGSRIRCTTEKESAGGLEGESPISLVSLKPRPKLSRSPQIKAEQGSSQTGEQKRAEETAQAPKDTGSLGILRTETAVTKTTTPLRYSQQNSSRRRQSEDLGAVSRRESVTLEQSEGFGAEHEMFTPQKFLPRNQTPIKVENAGSFGNTPEKFSKKRKSVPTSVDNLPTETEMVQQTVPAPLVLQAEGKIQNGFLNKTAGQTCPGAPGPDAADAGSFGDSINKVEGVSLKRRRVSFGGRLRPELFDENLPPNTPLKRGETPKQRRSLVAHTPAVLKKIIKEQPHPSGKGNSSETCPEVTTPDTCARAPAPATTSTPPAAADRCRRSPKASSVSSGSRSHQADTPKRGGRRSGNLPSKRASLDRSQHGILQMIYSKRRSGASEANLIVAKSWADVVKLGAKQTQTKAVKRGPQRPPSKRQRRANTPKKPTGIVDHQFSTGHANSPCTIIIGKAHIERVNGPARPYTMLNSFVFNKPADFSEDLSGLTEMFQTPVKKKPQRMSLGPSTLSNSGDFIGKKLPASNSGEEPLSHTSEYSGENVFPSAQEAPAEPSGKRSASPGRVKINERTVKTPGSVCQAPGAKRETPGSEAAPPKAAPSANRCRRCAEPRARQRPGSESASEDAELDAVEDILGRRLRNAPLPGQKPEGKGKESERFFESCKKNIESKEDSGKMMAVRRSRRASELKWEPTADLSTLMRLQETEFKEDSVDIPSVPQAPARAKEPTDAENRATKLRWESPQPDRISSPARTNTQPKTPSRKGDVEEVPALGKPTQTPGGATHTDGGPGDDENINLCKETPKQKLESAENVAGSKRRPRTPKTKAPPLEDLTGFKELFQTPHHVKEPMTDHKTPKVLCQSPQPEPLVTSTGMTRPLKTPARNAEMQEDVSALRKPTQTAGSTRPSHRGPAGDDESIRLLKETPEQKLESAENVTGSKRRPRTPKEKVPPLEDLIGFKELFQTPHHVKEPMTDDKTPQIPCKSPRLEPVDTPASRKGRLKTAPRKAEVQEGLSALMRPTQTSGDTTLSHRGPEGGDRGTAVSQETPKPKLDSAENVAVSKRRPRTPKEKAPPLEDLTGFKELFQTPDHAKEPVAEDKTTRIPCNSPPAEPVTRRTSRKRRLRSPPGKAGVGEVSALGEPSLTPGDATHREAVGDEKDVQVIRKTSRQKLDSTEKVIGVRSRLRSCKEKTQPLEDPRLKELVQKPRQTKRTMRAAKATTVPCQSPPAEPAPGPTGRKRRLKSPPEKVDVAEVSALREPIQAPGETTRTHGEPGSEEKDTQVFRKPSRQKLDPSENIMGMKSRLRTFKEKTQPLEAPDSLEELVQKPDQAREQTSDAKIPVMPCQSPPAQPVTRPTSRKRRLRSPPGKAGVGEVSALGEPTLTPGDATHREAVGDEKDVQVFRKTSRQKLGSAEKVISVGSRLRSRKEKTQPLEDPRLKELVRKPRQAKELGSGAAGVKRAPKEAPDGRNPAKIPQRVLRAPKLRFMEDLDLAGSEDPMKSPSASSVSPPPPKRRRGEDGSVTGRKTLRSTTATKDTVGEKPPQKPSTAPRDGWPQPESLVMRKKSLRTLAQRTEQVENLPDGDTRAKAMGRQAEDAHPPAKGMSLRSRGRSKTDMGEQQPEALISAEKVKMKRNEKKPLKTSQEKQLQRPEEGADHPASGGQVQERRMCLRSRRQQKTPSPAAAEESAGEEGAGAHGGSQEGEGAAERAGLPGLRSRRTAAHPPATPAESESERRVTRGARRRAGGPPKAGK
nr:proliferation marker protein Ki-67 [Vicugna pacos]